MSDNKQVTNPASGSATAVQEQQRAMLPPVDVFEDDSGITLLADMPGVPKEQLELKVEGDALLIEGGVQSHTPDGLEAIYAELRVPRYRRSFTLSRELDTTRIEANLKDGVLKLRIPKQAHAQPRRIAVTAG
ncbi:Hsp20/alpha crystallin family protein [Polaromonas sp. C04]|uniref:Hsp20/alpha crystallin family protein n=1 Tax=Polaromonas sp. C04 TaxID=1945857 RepID=UPI0009849048|nr:Hsp20/alpha crystallin family protein [Polaromonas sp. C04]OOG51948.1 heat-shock protein [Polaromonas sp. C04]